MLVKKVEAALVGQCDLLEDHNPGVDAIVAKVKVASARSSKDIDAKDKTAATEGVVEVKVEEITTEANREGGSVHVGYHYWKKLGLMTLNTESSTAYWMYPYRSYHPEKHGLNNPIPCSAKKKPNMPKSLNII